MNRSLDIVIEIKATPEEVFRAITEPGQIAKWFAPYARIEPRLGGKYAISWGPDIEEDSGSVITAWDPPSHFGDVSERSTAYDCKGTPVETGTMQRIAVDYYIEAIGGGITRLRLVQSGFGDGVAWDDEFEATRRDWPAILNKLKEILETV